MPGQSGHPGSGPPLTRSRKSSGSPRIVRRLILKHISGVNQPVAVFLPKSARGHHRQSGHSLYGQLLRQSGHQIAAPAAEEHAAKSPGDGVIITTAPMRNTLRAAGMSRKNRLLLLEEALTPKAIYDNAAVAGAARSGD